MKWTVGLLLCLAVVHAQERYSHIHIPLSTTFTAQRLEQLGVPLDCGAKRGAAGVDVWVPSRVQRALDEKAVPYSVLIDDWQKYFVGNNGAESVHRVQSFPPSRVSNFHPGSMGGFLTFQEVLDDLDAMRRFAPALISQNDTLGHTAEGRPIIAVRITASRAAKPPAVFYNSLTHAREPMGMMALVYFMWYCLEQYGQNDEVTRLLDGVALHFVPVVNPDGYEFNRRSAPTGGGMWRKNRRPAPGDSVGVDLNRNWGYAWGINGLPANPDPRGDTYSGPTPFSEPETDALRRYCIEHNFVAAMNYHTYGDLLIHPFGHDDIEPRDSVAFRRLARRITAVNRYTYGTSLQTVRYNTNGDAFSWMYADTTQHPPILAFLPEVGNGKDEFWPRSARIPVIAQDNLEANLQLAHEAVPFMQLASASAREDVDAITLLLQLTGTTSSPLVERIEVTSTSPHVSPDPVSLVNVAYKRGDVVELRIPKRRATAPSPSRIRFDVTTTTTESVMRDSIIVYPGAQQTVLTDDAETSDDAWILSGGWGREASAAPRTGMCFSDSPGGPYSPNATGIMQLRRTLDLRGFSSAALRFATRWHIRSGTDFGIVEVSSDGGGTWTALAGRATAYAFGWGVQTPLGMPGYDGKHLEWIDEVMDLTPFCGSESLALRFRIGNDGSVQYDGWQLDSIRIYTFGPVVTDVDPKGLAHHFSMAEPFPNPCIDAATVTVTLAARADVTCTVTDALGRQRSSITLPDRAVGAHHVNVLSTLPPGSYIVSVEARPLENTGEIFRSSRRVAKVGGW